MMIQNIDKSKLFKCTSYVNNYLECKLTPVAFDSNFYYYYDTNELRDIIKHSPLRIKIAIKAVTK